MPFQPLFVKVASNVDPGRHVHAQVSYIFASDPPETLQSRLQESPGKTCILADFDPATRKVVARSLSADWAVMDAQLHPAPRWQSEPDEGLMLLIKGMGPLEPLDETMTLQQLVQEYTRRLHDLDQVREHAAASLHSKPP